MKVRDEEKTDKKLKIETTGRDDSAEDNNHHAYEPTPYVVLDKLAESGYITKDNVLVDYGCGKGRVGLYLGWKLGCHSVGVEYNEQFYEAAERNQRNCVSQSKAEFVLANAEHYEVPEEADTFYFFNPFSVKILQSVMGRIRDSLYRNPREVLLMFYYPSTEYVGYLMTEYDLELVDEVDCGELFSENQERECVLVFQYEG